MPVDGFVDGRVDGPVDGFVDSRPGSSRLILLSNTLIPVGSANGTVLGTASIAGPVTGTPSWSITDATGTFTINSSTGVVTVLSNTDLSTPKTITITISVSGVTPSVASRHFGISVIAISGVLLESNFSGPQFEPWVFW